MPATDTLHDGAGAKAAEGIMLKKGGKGDWGETRERVVGGVVSSNIITALRNPFELQQVLLAFPFPQLRKKQVFDHLICVSCGEMGGEREKKK